jgi:hypothetical protein
MLSLLLAAVVALSTVAGAPSFVSAAADVPAAANVNPPMGL